MNSETTDSSVNVLQMDSISFYLAFLTFGISSKVCHEFESNLSMKLLEMQSAKLIQRNIAGVGSHCMLCYCLPTVQRTSVGYVVQRGPRTSHSTTPVSALAASNLSIRNGTFNDQVFKSTNVYDSIISPHLCLIFCLIC